MTVYISSIPSRYDGQEVIGWARTDTSAKGLHDTASHLYVDVALKLADGTRRNVTMEHAHDKFCRTQGCNWWRGGYDWSAAMIRDAEEREKNR